MFPCLDEPGYKATFEAEISVPSNTNLTVLFNTDEVHPAVTSRQVDLGAICEHWRVPISDAMSLLLR